MRRIRSKLLRLTPLAAALAFGPAWSQAMPGTGTAYHDDPQNEYVQDQTSDGIDSVNMILCIVHGMNAVSQVNSGPYIALVDQNKCDPRARSSASNSAGGATAAGAASSYITAVVDSTQAGTAGAPMQVKVWMSMTNNNGPQKVFAYLTASQSPTDVPPYGVFRLDYNGYLAADATGTPDYGKVQFTGFIESKLVNSLPELDHYETGSNSNNASLALSASTTTAGAGTMDIAANQSQNRQAAHFDFAYNPTNFRRSDGGANDVCFDRSKANADRSVWSYGTYSNDSTAPSYGGRVDLANPGFPVLAADQHGNTYFGSAGYWGINFQGLDLPDGSPVTGITVTDQRQDQHAGWIYSLSKVGGKLTQWNMVQTTLGALDGIPFVFNGDLGAASGSTYSWGNWQVVWASNPGGFTLIGQQSCGNNGCVISQINPPVVLTAAAMNSVAINAWSDAFGGNITIPPGTGSTHAASDSISYYTQQTVVPGAQGAPSSLVCLSQCPDAGSLTGFPGGSPFNSQTAQQWYSAQSGNTVSYTFDGGGLKQGGVAMVVEDPAKFSQGSQFQNGISTGRLFPSLVTSAPTVCPPQGTPPCVHEPDSPSVYYTWQTGPNAWNQSIWLTHSAQVVAFDPPVIIPYTVPANIASNQPYGDWATKAIQLQFGGFGNLWGIPGNCVSPVDNTPVDCSVANSRYVPQFSLPDGATMNATATTPPLIVKALNTELRLKVLAPPGQNGSPCSGLALSPLSPPTSGDVNVLGSNLLNTSTAPTVSGAPKVIDGIVQ